MNDLEIKWKNDSIFSLYLLILEISCKKIELILGIRRFHYKLSHFFSLLFSFVFFFSIDFVFPFYSITNQQSKG